MKIKKGKGYHMSVTGIGSSSINDTYTVNAATKEKTDSTVVNATGAEKVTSATAETSASKMETTNDTAAIYDKSKLSEDDR